METRDNWNYSRSLLFASAIPRDHTGLRAAYKASDRFVVTGFLVNGWNNVGDNNGAKSAGLSVSGKPTSDLTVTATYIGGPETTDDNSGARHLFDTVVSYNVNERTMLGANYDVGRDQHTQQLWQGAAVYLRYRVRGWLAAATRLELVSDPDGFMTGGSQRVGEFTLTAEIGTDRRHAHRISKRHYAAAVLLEEHQRDRQHSARPDTRLDTRTRLEDALAGDSRPRRSPPAADPGLTPDGGSRGVVGTVPGALQEHIPSLRRSRRRASPASGLGRASEFIVPFSATSSIAWLGVHRWQQGLARRRQGEFERVFRDAVDERTDKPS